MPVSADIPKTSQLSGEDVEKKYQTIVNKLNPLLMNSSAKELKQVEELASLKKEGIQVFSAHLGSVELLMLCRKRAGLKRLHEWLVNGRVEDIVRNLFNRLLETSDNEKIPFEVKWNELDYDNCEKYFKTWPAGQRQPIKRPLSDDSDRRGPDSGPKRPLLDGSSSVQTTGVLETTPSEIPPLDDSVISSLPVIVREMFIQRAIVQFFTLWNKTMTRPESRIFDIVSRVSGFWWIVIRRKGYRRRIRRILNEMCGPYRRHWIRLQRLQSESEEYRVRGVAHLDGHIYVVYSQATDGVGVYMDSAPYTALQSISIPEMRYPLDISACPNRHSLYVADWADGGDSGGRIWRATPRQNTFEALEECLEIEKPRKISLYKDRLMVVSGTRLVICNLDTFDVISRIELPEEILDPQHAVFSTAGTLLIGHGQKTDAPHRVTELSGDGQTVLRSYGDSARGRDLGQLSWPAHLCLGVEDGRTILADCDNSRLLMLNAQLHFERLLVSKDELENEGIRFNTPRRLCYMKESGILLIGLDYGYVDIYDIRRKIRQRSTNR